MEEGIALYIQAWVYMAILSAFSTIHAQDQWEYFKNPGKKWHDFLLIMIPRSTDAYLEHIIWLELVDKVLKASPKWKHRGSCMEAPCLDLGLRIWQGVHVQ